MRNVIYKPFGGAVSYVPLCVGCDKPTRSAPCEHCGKDNPIGTREEAADAINRRAYSSAEQFLNEVLNTADDAPYGTWHKKHDKLRDRLALMLLDAQGIRCGVCGSYPHQGSCPTLPPNYNYGMPLPDKE